MAKFDAAMEGDDAHAAATLYSPDSTRWVTDGEVRYENVSQIVDALEDLRRQGIALDTTYADVRADRLAPNVVLLTAAFSTRGSVHGANAFEFAGSIAMLLRADESGGWRIFYGHTSTPGGPPAASPE